ncbi:LysR family transcriptional regulator [Phenylobacterium sp.]|uniref:LysR family transcriptional regulator n=1 Tax=Phenylobacterium sp. TaxID=1871053 RepID=UPI0025D6F773|nr:LysR family transcriptional regulator [Phenylobacterium sp.]MBX3483249.1 LysR family transcriptional regulator [Phenylobacterium sp.]MCW5772096.1 LysR family transcriptional regulator [Rhodospirillaceae bacterium]
MERLDLAALDSFAAVARHRNFRRAAVERGVSASTLSQAVRGLETRMGVRLLHRTTRSVAPTEAGAALLARLGPALIEIGEAMSEARSAQAEPSGALRINAPEPAVELVLAPMATGFLRAHPAVRLEIVSETGLIDIVAEGYDAGVRWGESLAQDMVAVSLGPPQRYVVAAAPELLARVGAPQHPRDLLERPCLRNRFPSGAMPSWELEKAGEAVRVSPGGPLVANSPTTLVRAALDGLGFISLFDGYLAPHLESGRLVEVLADWSEPFPGPFLYYPSRRTLPSPLRAFVDFVQAGRRR